MNCKAAVEKARTRYASGRDKILKRRTLRAVKKTEQEDREPDRKIRKVKWTTLLLK